MGLFLWLLFQKLTHQTANKNFTALQEGRSVLFGNLPPEASLPGRQQTVGAHTISELSRQQNQFRIPLAFLEPNTVVHSIHIIKPTN